MESEYLGIVLVTDSKRQKLLDNKTWITRDGEIIPIKEMDIWHLRNCINLLAPLKKEKYYRTWRTTLRRELNRKLKNYDNSTNNRR